MPRLEALIDDQAGRRIKLSSGFEEPRIILAIDYGTTFTGISSINGCHYLELTLLSLGLAWIQSNGEAVPESSDVKLFQNWPEKTEAKVPSEVSYSLTAGDVTDREFRQWGFSIDSESKVLRWTKLELVKDPSPLGELEILDELMDGLEEINQLYADDNETADVPFHLSETSKDVIEYYLSHVAREWVKHITLQAQEVLNTVPVDLIITHPAVWLPLQTNLYNL